MRNTPRRSLVPAALVAVLTMAAVPVPAAAAPPLRPGAIVAVGLIGANQYDRGKARGVIAAGFSGLWQPRESLSFGGLGLGFRASNGIYQDFSELGITVPIVTVRRGRWITQAGWMVQRLNMQKHLFYLGTGISFTRERLR